MVIHQGWYPVTAGALPTIPILKVAIWFKNVRSPMNSSIWSTLGEFSLSNLFWSSSRTSLYCVCVCVCPLQYAERGPSTAQVLQAAPASIPFAEPNGAGGRQCIRQQHIPAHRGAWFDYRGFADGLKTFEELQPSQRFLLFFSVFSISFLSFFSFPRDALVGKEKVQFCFVFFVQRGLFDAAVHIKQKPTLKPRWFWCYCFYLIQCSYPAQPPWG